MMQIVCSEAVRSNKMIVGHIDEDDNLHLEYTEIPKREEDNG